MKQIDENETIIYRAIIYILASEYAASSTIASDAMINITCNLTASTSIK